MFFTAEQLKSLVSELVPVAGARTMRLREPRIATPWEPPQIAYHSNESPM